jgi:hypothetical protein
MFHQRQRRFRVDPSRLPCPAFGHFWSMPNRRGSTFERSLKAYMQNLLSYDGTQAVNQGIAGQFGHSYGWPGICVAFNVAAIARARPTNNRGAP